MTLSIIPLPILIIGGGRMGTALVEGWHAAGLYPRDVHIVETDRARLKALKKRGYHVSATLPDISPAITLLAIKPQAWGAFAETFAPWCRARREHLVLSIMAGVTIAALQKTLGVKRRIIRAMPNTPALVGEAVTALVASPKVRPVDMKHITALFSVVGDVVRLAKESDMDAATALSGSGPAYVFYFLESLIAAGVKAGLPEAMAHPMALQTLRGALALAEQSPSPLAQLRADVTSPGGTTEAALAVLMDKKSGLAPLVSRTVTAAKLRAKALGK